MDEYPDKSLMPQLVQLGLARKIVAGNLHSFAITDQGLYAWGDNSNGVLGIQSETEQIVMTPTFVNLKADNIATHSKHTFAICSNLEVYGWGSNVNCELGLEQQKVYGITKINYFEEARKQQCQIKAIACGDIHSLAIITLDEDNQNRMFAWGNSKSHQLTLDSTLIIPYPVLCEFDNQVEQIYSKNDYNIAITKQNEVYSWGSNIFGRLGFPNIKMQRIPKRISIQNVSKIGIGTFHVIAVTTNGQAYSWGSGLHGQLGICKIVHESQPTKVNILQFVTDASCGEQHSLFLTNCHEIYSCGSNSNCCLGYETQQNQKKKALIPKKIRIDNVQQISSGIKHNLVLTKDRKLYTWGDNSRGQLGLINQSKPIQKIKQQPFDLAEKVKRWQQKYNKFLQQKIEEERLLMQQLNMLLGRHQ